MSNLGLKTISAFIFSGVTLNKERFNSARDMSGEGVIEICEAAVEYADLLEEAYVELTNRLGCPGVYDYEVAEPFGEWFRDYMVDHDGYLPTSENCVPEIRKILMSFFTVHDRRDADEVEGVISDFFKGRSE